MFIIAHIAAGLILGKLTGNYYAALAGALILDIDHMIVYARHKILLSPRKFWKAITDPEDPYGSQRNIFHSLIGWLIILMVTVLAFQEAGFIFSIAYLSHLVLDFFDGSDFYPLYPMSKLNFKGPITYFSKAEICATLALFIMFFIV